MVGRASKSHFWGSLLPKFSLLYIDAVQMPQNPALITEAFMQCLAFKKNPRILGM